MEFSFNTGISTFGYRPSWEYKPFTNTFDLNQLFNVTYEKERFSTKEELWAKAEKIIKEEDGMSYSLFNNLIQSRVERKVLELFVEELEKIAGKWTGSSEQSERIIGKITQRFERAILDYLGINNERFFFYNRFKLQPFTLLAYPSNIYGSVSFGIDESIIEDKLSEAISEFFNSFSKPKIETNYQEFIPYRLEGKIESNLNWEEFIRKILSEVRIFVIRVIFEQETYKVPILASQFNLFYSTISFMQTKASLA